MCCDVLHMACVRSISLIVCHFYQFRRLSVSICVGRIRDFFVDFFRYSYMKNILSLGLVYVYCLDLTYYVAISELRYATLRNSFVYLKNLWSICHGVLHLF